MTSHWPLASPTASRTIRRCAFLGCLLVLLLSGATFRLPAAEPVAIAGTVEAAPDTNAQLARYFLRSARTGKIVAGLLDPRGLIRQVPVRLILQTDRLPGADVNGLPLFTITGVAPEFWAQPVSYGPHQMGPGAYAVVGDEVRPVDFAGKLFEDLRATEVDGGLDADAAVPFASTPQPPTNPPLRLADVQFNGRSLRLSWPGVAGVVYQLLFATDPRGPFTVLQQVGAPASGEVTFNVSTAGQTGYFRIAVVQPNP